MINSHNQAQAHLSASSNRGGTAQDVDYNLHLSEKKEDGMKVCRGPFNVNCTTSKDPQLVLFEMVKSLELQKVLYKKIGSYGLRCNKNNVRFDMEIAHLDNLENIYIVKFKRIAGEIWSYKEVSSKVLNNMNL